MQTPSSMVRSASGQMRIDTPGTTVITNPAAQQAVVLNHLTKEAQIVPLLPQPPQMPQLGMPPVSVQDLGKSMIDGHPVDGMRYVVQTPAAPQAPTISEVWTSSQLKMPVLTKVTTPSGVQTTLCKPAPMAEPDPSLFQIPPGYKVLMPKRG